MLQKDNRSKILRVFFDNPLAEGGGFQLRELSRKVGVSPPSVKEYLKELEKEELIIKDTHRIHGYPVYYANRNSDYFLFLKKFDNIIRLKESGLLDYVNDTCMPRAIILYGSYSRGEDILGGDIDLFVLSKEDKLDLDKYEKRLGRNIHIFFSDNFGNHSKELKNNLINGIMLGGYLKVFEDEWKPGKGKSR